MASDTTADVTIRALSAPDEMRAVVDLQYETWGPEDSTPANQLLISAKSGGHVLGAFAQGQLVAFAYAFPAVLPGRPPWLASHMLATRKGYEGRGVGRLLKWRQREWALERGFERITWTFDPLEARNCHLNLNVLGAVAAEYMVDCYGTMQDRLNFGLPSDRFMAHWELRSARVEAAVRGEAPGGVPEEAVRVAIARDFQALKKQGMDLALTERLRVRKELQPLIEAGGRVVGYDRAASELLVAAVPTA